MLFPKVRIFSALLLLIVTIIICVLYSKSSSAEFEVPPVPNGYVFDEADLLTPELEQTLNEILSNNKAETSTEIVLVTLNDLQGYPIEEASLAIGRGWGVGQEEFDNGVVFLIAPNEREMRIEVGYGLEGAITDIQAGQIIRNVATPAFQAEEYERGISESIYALITLSKGEEFDVPSLDQEGIAGAIFYFVLMFFWALLSFMSQSKSWWLGGVVGVILGAFLGLESFGSMVVGAILLGSFGLVIDYIVSTHLYKSRLFRGGGGFGGGRGGGGSGGFGGFGGGSFGGGGASGGW